MATDRSTDDYKNILAATVHGLLQNPTPQNKMDILAADAVHIADKVTAALADAVKADQETDGKTPSKGPATPSTPSSPAPGPSIPLPPTGK